MGSVEPKEPGEVARSDIDGNVLMAGAPEEKEPAALIVGEMPHELYTTSDEEDEEDDSDEDDEEPLIIQLMESMFARKKTVKESEQM